MNASASTDGGGGTGRILGLDYGLVRLGLAVSDELGMIARPLATLNARALAPLLAEIRRHSRDTGARLLVVGVPLNADGEVGASARKVLHFVEKLKAGQSLPVTTWDESHTTLEAAQRLKKGRNKAEAARGLDAMAAAVMLQDYLDQQGPGGPLTVAVEAGT